MVCRRSARSSGQWVGQRRLCKEYMARIEAKTEKHQTIGAASAVETHVELYSVPVKGGPRTSSNPYSVVGFSGTLCKITCYGL